MQEHHDNLKQKLLEEVDDLPDEQMADVVEYADMVKSRPKRRPGQGLDARGLEIIWRCAECGYIQGRGEPLPDNCPSCGASKEAFALIEED